MDNEENAEQIIALSNIEEQSFDECHEIIIEDNPVESDVQVEENHTEELVLDIDENVATDLYSQEDELKEISSDINDVDQNGERKKAGGQHFMLNSVEALKEILEDYYERTSTRFVGWRKTKNFGLPSNECCLSGHQVQWCDTVRNTNNGLDNLVPFDGIPYMIVGHYDMDCQFGNDRNASGKAKRQQKKAAGIINTRTHHFSQPTKRCGCPAKISVKQIIRFPEFKIDSDSKWKKNDRSMKLKAKLKECRENVLMEVCFVGRLPEVDEHKHHDSAKATEAVLQELIVLAQEFYLEDRTYSQIQQMLQQYVVDHLFWNKPPPHRTRRKFYPTLRDVRYFCTRALHLLRFTDDEQECMRKVISDIETRGVNVSFILSEGKLIKHDDSDSLLDDSERTDALKKLPRKTEEKKIQSFLFCTQTDPQRRLLKRYNNVAFLIEVIDKLPIKYAYVYKMYTIVVQTNVDYQVAGCIAVSKQKKDGLCDALKLFREWNPTWNPKYFMVDCAQVIYEAVSNVFPECQYFLNAQSCEEKWYEFLNKPSNNLQEHSEEIMNYLKTMQYSLTEDSLSVAAALLEASDIWQDRDNLREWFQNSWLPLAKQWVFGYRPEDMMILQHLKATIDDCLNVYREVLRKASKFKGFLEMIEQVSCSIPYTEYEKYVERNKKAYLFYKHYTKSTNVPDYVKNVPKSLLPYIEGVCKLAESTNFNITRDNYDTFTVQYSQLDQLDQLDQVINVVEATLSECSNWRRNEDDDEQQGFVLKQGKMEDQRETDIIETEFGWIEYASKVSPGENTISFGDCYSHPFCTCSHWLLYRLPCVHIVSVFYRISGWKYDMMSPLYRASPLLDIDCSAIDFPINEPPDLYTRHKESQTDFEPVDTATQTHVKGHTGLLENVLEVPSKIWDYFIVLTQTRDFLKHLDKMAFLFKDKNLHRKFRLQVEEVIRKLEDNALKKRGQKIEFTTRATPRGASDETSNSLKISSLNLESIPKGGETKKIIVSNGGEVSEETITGIYRVNNNENTKVLTGKSAKITPNKKLIPPSLVSDSGSVPSVCPPSVAKPDNSPLCESTVEKYEVSLSTKTTLSNAGNDKNLVVNDLPLLVDIRDRPDVNNRKRKITDFHREVVRPKSKMCETNLNISASDSVTSNNLAPAEKKDFLSVLKYLPLLNKAMTPKQVTSTSGNAKIGSKIDLLRCLPPHVGLTRPSSTVDFRASTKEENLICESNISDGRVPPSPPLQSRELNTDFCSNEDCTQPQEALDPQISVVFSQSSPPLPGENNTELDTGEDGATSQSSVNIHISDCTSILSGGNDCSISSQSVPIRLSDSISILTVTCEDDISSEQKSCEESKPD